MIQKKRLLLFSVTAIAALMALGLGTSVLAWGPEGGDGYWNHGCCSKDWGGGGNGPSGHGEWIGPAVTSLLGGSPFQSGWDHGVADAQFDHLHDLVYNNDGACNHSPIYWEGFHHGYDHQWNGYQS